MLPRVFLIAVLLLTAGLCLAADKPEQAAEASAQQWLALSDGAKYAESWDAASAGFKAHVTKTQWEHAIETVRAPLGSIESRKLSSAKYTRQLPGAPDGEYVVIQYSTSFANKKESVETITMQQEKDGQWRTAGYFIR